MDHNEFHQTITRAGVIPRVKRNGMIFYAFGIDLDTGIICDFGGHIECRDHSLVDTAIREFTEETHESFGNIEACDLNVDRPLLGGGTVEYILDLPSDRSLSYWNRKFKSKVNDRKYTREISDILWLTGHQVISILRIRYLSVDGYHPYSIHSGLYDVLVNNIDILGIDSNYVCKLKQSQS